MNKSELIDALAAKTDVTKAAAGKSIEALLEIITAAVANGDDVALIGFGTFKASSRAARTGKNSRRVKPWRLRRPRCRPSRRVRASRQPSRRRKRGSNPSSLQRRKGGPG